MCLNDNRIVRRLRGEKGQSMVETAIVLPLLLITIVVLVVSIIGIPLLVLLPFAFLILMIVALVGVTGVAYYVGGLLANRFGWTDRGAYVFVVLGVLAIALITLIARAGATTPC